MHAMGSRAPEILALSHHYITHIINLGTRTLLTVRNAAAPSSSCMHGPQVEDEQAPHPQGVCGDRVESTDVRRHDTP